MSASPMFRNGLPMVLSFQEHNKSSAVVHGGIFEHFPMKPPQYGAHPGPGPDPKGAHDRFPIDGEVPQADGRPLLDLPAYSSSEGLQLPQSRLRLGRCRPLRMGRRQ